jgi:hypothetical protein
MPPATATEASPQQTRRITHCAALHAHCDRMLGSVHDTRGRAADRVAGTRGSEGRSRLKSWLYTIVSKDCVKMMERRPITMPPQPTWYRGRDAIASFLRAVPLATGAGRRLPPAAANGQLAFGEYRWNDATKRFVGRAVMVLTIADALIAGFDPDRAVAAPPPVPSDGSPTRGTALASRLQPGRRVSSAPCGARGSNRSDPHLVSPEGWS